MAKRSSKPCMFPRCPELTEGQYCIKHKKDTGQKYNRERGTSSQRGYDSRWRKARKSFLSSNPLCVHCKEQRKLTAATVIDHIIPHKGDMVLFWDENNWQSLCASCHNRKTAREDGGFGNR
ncbi:HNH endonuclease [Brevibacillus sp. VP]|uniref:HNH endonuclease n=1 Tax=Brevibacillus sp. VP TaxID=2293326 RepID=UPI000E2EEE16|nr:HNH endonuclease signature motif containing protein [Brevibacillus sp. VP]RFB28226.1 HNH endonuclease [Brevibacillus sp. VP]